MWSVFWGLSGHTAACWFCHETTKLAPTTNTHDWFCTRCQNHNTLDAAGNIVDARAEMYRETPTAQRPLPPAADAAPQAFCTTCQRNQELVRQILASYLPDEDDPDHSSRVAGADEYARALRRRYPLVCRACQRTVDQRLQEQAQWLCRRQLAGALARSSERVLGPHTLLPSLRRKPVVVTWIACAIVALIGCPLATWAWYYYVAAEAATRAAASDWYTTACVGFALAALTYMARWLNPLWLYVAYNPGVRVAGLALYKRRLVRLAVLRGCAALVQPQHWALWALVGSYDVALTVLALGSVCARTGKRQQQQQQQRHCDDSARSETARASGGGPPDLPLLSFESMSFGPSESNRDQDDSFWGASLADPPASQFAWRGGSQHQRPDAGSSGDETNTEIVSGLDTLTFESPLRPKVGFSRKQSAEAMDVDVRTPALSNRRNITDQLLLQRRQTNSRAPSDVSGPRPFEAFKFHRDVPTGLESKLSAFSIDDDEDDDGSYQGPFGSSAMDLRLLGIAPHALVLRMCIVGCVVGSWFSTWMHVAWLVRIALTAALLCVAARKWMSLAQPGSVVKGVAWAAGAGLLLAALIGIPVLYALQGLDEYPSVAGIPDGEEERPGIVAPHVAHWWASVLVRWPQTRPLVGHSVRCFLDAHSNTACASHRSLPPLVRMDWSAEAAALLYIALA